MKLTEARQLAAQQANDSKTTQAIVRLKEPFRGKASYIPIASRSASGLRGKVVSELKPA